MDDELREKLIDGLQIVKDILLHEVPNGAPDMDVSEWNATPIGRAVNMLGDIGELIYDA